MDSTDRPIIVLQSNGSFFFLMKNIMDQFDVKN